MAIYDIDEDDDRPFLVIEYVEGHPLSHYIPSAVDVTVNLGIQIAQALQYAHEREIIHRDIKPANIQVTSNGQIKLMDLGLALPREAKRVTAHGMVIGTPAYLSPEQAQGLKLDHRTDIYSLGIVLYEMVTGQLPFNADDIGALLLQQVKQPPPPPRLIVSDLPVALENVILKALEKNPNRRFQSGMAMVAALQATISPQPSADTATIKSRPEWADSLPENPQDSGKPLRVVLADDHTLLRKSLAGLLETRDDFVVVAEAADGEAAIEQTLSVMPDILLLDLNMPKKGGLEVLPEVRSKAPNVKVLVLTGRDEDSYIIRALRAGAHGYILKSSEETDLIDAITKVMQNQLVLGTGVAEKIVGGMLSPDANAANKLDDVDQAILLHVAAGYENDAIAHKLGISLMDLIEKVARIMDKLEAEDRHSAALKALRHGHIILDDLHTLGTAD